MKLAPAAGLCGDGVRFLFATVIPATQSPFRDLAAHHLKTSNLLNGLSTCRDRRRLMMLHRTQGGLTALTYLALTYLALT